MKPYSPLRETNSIPSSSAYREHLKVFNTKMRIGSSRCPSAGVKALKRIQHVDRIFFQLEKGQEKTVNVLRNSRLLIIKVLSVHLLHPDQSVRPEPCAVNQNVWRRAAGRL